MTKKDDELELQLLQGDTINSSPVPLPESEPIQTIAAPVAKAGRVGTPLVTDSVALEAVKQVSSVRELFADANIVDRFPDGQPMLVVDQAAFVLEQNGVLAEALFSMRRKITTVIRMLESGDEEGNAEVVAELRGIVRDSNQQASLIVL